MISSLSPVPFNETLLSPVRRTTFSPRFDWQINETNTLIARYTYDQNKRVNEGVGGFNLASRAYDVSSSQHTFQITETAVLNAKSINETRLQFIKRDNGRGGDALLAFFLNGHFIAGIAQAVTHGELAVAGVLSFFEAGWYAGNVYSAINGAHKHNRRTAETFLRNLENRYRFQPPEGKQRQTYGLQLGFTF